MSGSRVEVDLRVTEAALDGAPGGASLQVEDWFVHVANVSEQKLVLAGSPVTIQLPPAGASSLFVQVLEYTVAPTLTWVVDGVTKTETFTGGRGVWNDAAGPLITSASIVGTGLVRVFAAG